MIPTNSQVYRLVRSFLNDTEASSGQLFTDQYQRQWLEIAFSELVRALGLQESPYLRRHSHFNLPAFQSRLFPFQFGARDFGEPIDVRERAVAGTRSVTAFDPEDTTPDSSYADLTLDSAHGLVDGDIVVVYGMTPSVSEDVHGEWSISVPSPAVVRLLGSGAQLTSKTAYSSGGVVSWSGEEWSEPLNAFTDLIHVPMKPTTELGHYAWARDAFVFSPSSEIRQLKITHTVSGAIPDGREASLGVDDSLDFLAHRTAALCASAKGGAGSRHAAELNMIAVGARNGIIDFEDPGGKLGELISISVRSMQRNEYEIPPFRELTSTGIPGDWLDDY